MTGTRAAASQRLGLRERKKAATRRALSQAAIRLAAERGWDNVRVEDIAEAVGVSARTFNNYFSTKEQAVVAGGIDRADRVRAALLARPAAEPVWEALSQAVIATVLEDESELGVAIEAHLRLVAEHPALAAERVRFENEAVGTLATGVAERIGADPLRDLYPRLAATVALATASATLTHWAVVRPGSSLLDLLRDALRSVSVARDGA